MKDKLELIIDKLYNNENDWFLENGIIVKDKENYWILNYQQFADKNTFNVLTRGLLVHKNKTLASCPFFRFFNYGESCAASVNFATSDIIEKLDGSLVTVFFPDENPAWHFRSLLSTYSKDRELCVKGFTTEPESILLLEVEPFLKKISFPDHLKDFSIIFELVCKSNAIITKYDQTQYGLYLIGARNLTTLEEHSEDELDELAKTLEVPRPRRWEAESYEDVLNMMSNFPKDYEGFVVRDRETGDRIKIKSKDYLERHRLLSKLNYKNLIPRYFEGERSEIEVYLPQSKEFFDKIEKCYKNFVEIVLETLLFWQSKNVSRKEVALGMVAKKEVKSVVFKLIDVKENQEERIKDLVRNMRPESLIEAWYFDEEP